MMIMLMMMMMMIRMMIMMLIMMMMMMMMMIMMILDRLSSSDSGLRLSQHYVHTTCTPSRAALMTGR